MPSAANFIAVEVPVGADAAYEALLESGVIVRSGDGLGMPGRLRVSIGTPAENARLRRGARTLLAQWRAAPAGVAGAAT